MRDLFQQEAVEPNCSRETFPGNNKLEQVRLYKLDVKRCYNLPLEKGVSFHLNKLEFPSPKHALCHDLLRVAEWFLKYCQCSYDEDFKCSQAGNGKVMRPIMLKHHSDTKLHIK